MHLMAPLFHPENRIFYIINLMDYFKHLFLQNTGSI